MSFVKVAAQIRVDQQLNKPFFGKPFVKLGQCWILWTYFFQLGGILALKYSDRIDAFGNAFLGLKGKPGAMKHYLSELAEDYVLSRTKNAITFMEYIGNSVVERVKYTGNAFEYFTANGFQKMKPDFSIELSIKFAEEGAAFGAIQPANFRKMYDQFHGEYPKDKWDREYGHGLDIPKIQEIVKFEDALLEDDKMFMSY